MKLIRSFLTVALVASVSAFAQAEDTQMENEMNTFAVYL